jgi:prepilin-type N-terminal cleavage/methylation domain-containing protein
MNKSFTLIEILIVIVVIGIISSFIIVGLSSVSDKANITKGQAFSNSLRNSLLMNLVSEWKLDGNTNDSWGVNNGTWNGSGGGSYASPSWRTGSECVSGGCLAFDGIDDYINCGSSNSLNISNLITISVWIKPLGTSGQEGIIGTPNFSSAYGFYIRHTPGLDVAFQFNTGSTRYNLLSGNLNYKNWNYLVVSWDGSNIKIYINNNYYSGQSSTAQSRTFGEFRIGYTGAITSPVYFNGLIDDVKIYNQAIPTYQVQQNYYSGLNKLFANKGIADYSIRISQLKEVLTKNMDF